jgi:hypothetical protein
MSDKTVGDPQIKVNPIMATLYGLGWEPPVPPEGPFKQILTALAIHALAEKIYDNDKRKMIQNTAAKTVANCAQEIVRDSL